MAVPLTSRPLLGLQQVHEIQIGLSGVAVCLGQKCTLTNTGKDGKLKLQKRGNPPERLCRTQAGQPDSELEGGVAIQ